MSNAGVTNLALSASMQRPLRWLVALALLLPLVLVGVALALSWSLARTAPAVLLAPAALVFVTTLAMYFWLRRMFMRIAARIEGDRLHLETGFSRGDYALAELAANGLRVVDLDAEREHRPGVRTWGIGLPGLASGWFRLRSGERALCILTGAWNRVCLLRAHDGTRILLSLADPAILRAALERGAASVGGSKPRSG
jgi:hypothetical protein